MRRARQKFLQKALSLSFRLARNPCLSIRNSSETTLSCPLKMYSVSLSVSLLIILIKSNVLPRFVAVGGSQLASGANGRRGWRIVDFAYWSVFEFNHSIARIKIRPWQGFGKHQQIRVRSPCLANLARRFSSAYTSP